VSGPAIELELERTGEIVANPLGGKLRRIDLAVAGIGRLGIVGEEWLASLDSARPRQQR
jgi:hypothetical protein